MQSHKKILLKKYLFRSLLHFSFLYLSLFFRYNTLFSSFISFSPFFYFPFQLLGFVWIQGCHCWRRRMSQQHPVWIHAWLRVSVEGSRKLSELFICVKKKRKLHCRWGVPSHPKQVTKLPLLLLESRNSAPAHACHMKP